MNLASCHASDQPQFWMTHEDARFRFCAHGATSAAGGSRGEKLVEQGIDFAAPCFGHWQERRTRWAAIVATAVEGVLEPGDAILRAKHLAGSRQFLLQLPRSFRPAILE